MPRLRLRRVVPNPVPLVPGPQQEGCCCKNDQRRGNFPAGAAQINRQGELPLPDQCGKTCAATSPALCSCVAVRCSAAHRDVWLSPESSTAKSVKHNLMVFGGHLCCTRRGLLPSHLRSSPRHDLQGAIRQRSLQPKRLRSVAALSQVRRRIACNFALVKETARLARRAHL
jgi:hypothetical protein